MCHCRVVNRLKPFDVECLDLLVEGFGYHDIATALKVPIYKVKMTMSRLRKRFGLPEGRVVSVQLAVWWSYPLFREGALTPLKVRKPYHRVGNGHERWHFRARPEDYARAAQMLTEGIGVREVRDACHLAQHTVCRIRREVAHLIKPCACGKAGGHQGWCWVRLERSSKRQALIATWHHA